MFWVRLPQRRLPLHRVVRATDVVHATTQCKAQYPTATIVACWQLHDVLWAVREVEQVTPTR
jgi:hypothetical protein